MKLIVGLGNYVNTYSNSRHNIGFSVIKTLGRAYKSAFKKEKDGLALCGKINISGQPVALAMPLTFMNLSGIAVRALVRRYRINLPELLVVCDDMDLEFGRLKIKPKGSSGGHRGLQSIVDILGGCNFARLRIGIGRPPEDIDSARYVLSGFSKKEKEKLKIIIARAKECCQSWVIQGIEEAMNIFNQSASTLHRGHPLSEARSLD